MSRLTKTWKRTRELLRIVGERALSFLLRFDNWWVAVMDGLAMGPEVLGAWTAAKLAKAIGYLTSGAVAFGTWAITRIDTVTQLTMNSWLKFDRWVAKKNDEAIISTHKTGEWLIDRAIPLFFAWAAYTSTEAADNTRNLTSAITHGADSLRMEISEMATSLSAMENRLDSIQVIREDH